MSSTIDHTQKLYCLSLGCVNDYLVRLVKFWVKQSYVGGTVFIHSESVIVTFCWLLFILISTFRNGLLLTGFSNFTFCFSSCSYVWTAYVEISNRNTCSVFKDDVLSSQVVWIMITMQYEVIVKLIVAQQIKNVLPFVEPGGSLSLSWMLYWTLSWDILTPFHVHYLFKAHFNIVISI
jgi:hypothetical protein